MGWLIALGVLTLIAILPIGVSAIYDEGGPKASVIAGPIRIPIYPVKKYRRLPERNRKRRKKAAVSMIFCRSWI